MSERLYRTTDGEIVAEGDDRAAFLVVGPSGAVPAEWADAVADFRKGGEKAKPAPADDEKVVEPKAAAKPKRTSRKKSS